MDPKDLEIEARLQRLRGDVGKSNLSDDQLVARLAGLKGPNKAGLTDEDLVQRLSNVKGNKQPPTEDELERRLAKIKGSSAASPVPTSNSNILITKMKTDVEQVNDLLKQLVTETDIDSCVTSSTTKLVEEKKSKHLPQTQPASSSSLKQETLAFVDKLVAESKLAPYPESVSSDEEEDTEIDDWCTICNEDASLRCKGCSGDLYCSSCYKEFHTPSDTEDDHQCEKFVKTKRTIETAL